MIYLPFFIIICYSYKKISLERGYTKIVKILLESGAHQDMIDSNQTSPLWVAAKEGHDEIVLILLNKGADPNWKAHDGTTALFFFR